MFISGTTSVDVVPLMKTAGVVENYGHCIYSIGSKCFPNCHSLFHLVFYIYIYIYILYIYIHIYIYNLYIYIERESNLNLSCDQHMRQTMASPTVPGKVSMSPHAKKLKTTMMFNSCQNDCVK